MSDSSVLPSENPSSLAGNAATYQSGGKRRANKTGKKRVVKRPSKKTKKTCWWKFW